jgi:cysteine-rich repeat protein
MNADDMLRISNVNGGGGGAAKIFVGCSQTGRTMSVWVNNVKIGTITGNTANNVTAEQPAAGLNATLLAGTGNVIEIRDTEGSTELNIDYIRVAGALPSCGDGTVNQASEQCDDGNTVNTDSCSNTCQTPTCSDGIKNQGEFAIDCGGTSPCAACPVGCNDGIQNNGETGIDCGVVCGNSCVQPPVTLSAGSTTPAGTVGPPTRSGSTEVGAAYTIIKVTGGKLCWSNINMTGRTKLTMRYSNGEGADKVTFTYNDPTVLSADQTVANATAGGAWSGDAANLVVNFPAQTGTGTFCVQGGTGANGFIASIKQIILE